LFFFFLLLLLLWLWFCSSPPLSIIILSQYVNCGYLTGRRQDKGGWM
jgi:hypothetical protein